MKRRYFSLIELLIVIVIIGVLTAIILPQFNITESVAREAVGAHNAAGLERTIRQFQNIHGVYPTGWHTGMADDGSQSVTGLSLEVALNISADANVAGGVVRSWDGTYTVNNPKATTLTVGMARALKENGIHLLSHNGYGYDKNGDEDDSNDFESGFSQNVAAGCHAWILSADGGEDLMSGGSAADTTGDGNIDTYTLGASPVSINGREMKSWSNSTWSNAVICVFVTPQIQWGGSLAGYWSSNPDQPGTWQGKCKVGMETPPTDPAAGKNSKFPYYIAVFNLASGQVGNDDGWSCKLLGVLDQNMKPVVE